MRKVFVGLALGALVIGFVAVVLAYQRSHSTETNSVTPRFPTTAKHRHKAKQQPGEGEGSSMERVKKLGSDALRADASTAVGNSDLKVFQFDTSLPLYDQVAALLSDVLERDEFSALLEHKNAVAPILMQLAKDRNANNDVRESAILLLPKLGEGKAVSMIAQLAKDDPSEGVRVCSIKALGDFGSRSSERQLRSIHDSAKSEDERLFVVEALGKVGNAKALPFLKELERNTSDAGTQSYARRAITQIEIEKSPQKESDLVRLLYEEQDLRMKHWALNKIIRERYPSASYYLRQAFEMHRQLPKEQRDGLVEYRLLSGIQSLGGELSSREQEHLKDYNRLNSGPFKN